MLPLYNTSNSLLNRIIEIAAGKRPSLDRTARLKKIPEQNNALELTFFLVSNNMPKIKKGNET
jgi:hypothetical protein